MDTNLAPRGNMVAVSLGLLAASLITLYLGGFVQFNDITGYGSDRWIVPLGWLAGFLALGAVAAASQDRTARRWVGGTLAALDVVLVAQSIMNDGFRFVWGALEGELFYLQVVLGLTALTLLAPTLGSTTKATSEGIRAGRRRSGWERATIYLTAITMGMFLAFVLGTAHFEASQCSGPDFDGECDLAALSGLFWAACSLVLGLVGISVAEALGFQKRRALRHSSSGMRTTSNSA